MYNPSFPIACKMPSIAAIRAATKLHTPIGASLGSKGMIKNLYFRDEPKAISLNTTSWKKETDP